MQYKKETASILILLKAEMGNGPRYDGRPEIDESTGRYLKKNTNYFQLELIWINGAARKY